MSYRLRLIITITVLIAVTFSVGGTILITSSFQGRLDTETNAALNNFQMVLGTLSLVNSLGAKADYGSLGAAMEQLSGRQAGRWQAIRLSSSANLPMLPIRCSSLPFD